MKKNLCILFVAFVFGVSAFSHDGYEHIRDMASVLGASISNNNNLDSLLKLVTNSIDDHTGNTRQDSLYGGTKYYQVGYNVEFYKKIQKKYPTFVYKTEEYTHRILFHWGFDKIDKDLIRESVTKNNPLFYSFSKYVENYEKMWSSFLKEIKEVQKTKAFLLTTAFNDFFIFNNLDIAYNMAALCYYVHILGDHIGYTNEMAVLSVMTTDNILYELDKSIKVLSDYGLGKSIYISYKNEIEQLYEKKIKISDKIYSEKALSIMKKHVPKIMKLNFKEYFDKQGIILY